MNKQLWSNQSAIII